MANEYRELAALIRIGSKDTEQCRGKYADNAELFLGSVCGFPSVPKKTCAVGAALWAKYGLTKFINCAEIVLPAGTMVPEIIYRNDKLKQTREAIADWLEEIAQ